MLAKPEPGEARNEAVSLKKMKKGDGSFVARFPGFGLREHGIDAVGQVSVYELEAAGGPLCGLHEVVDEDVCQSHGSVARTVGRRG